MDEARVSITAICWPHSDAHFREAGVRLWPNQLAGSRPLHCTKGPLPTQNCHSPGR